MTKWSPRRIVAALTMLAIVTAPTPASADPPGPTDFATSVLSIEPPTDGIDIEIVGGDSFVLLTNTTTRTVEVIGYTGEPYLRFLPGGTVEQNRLSPAVYLNEERFGGEIPAFADAAAAPEWEEVADDGSHAWHDHRAHLMTGPPVNTSPGEQVLADVIPLFVDGEEVDVSVVSFWQTAPSRLPLVVGAILGCVAAAVAWWRRAALSAILVLSAGLIVLAGFVQYFSVPPETGPSSTLVALPIVAAVCSIGAVVTRRRPATALPLLIGAALASIVFVARRLPDTGKAILPTDLSMPLDRGISVFVAIAATAALVLACAGFVRLMRPDRPATPSV